MKYTFTDLLKIMETLRSENGCPWDKEQNTYSLLPYLIEETHEFIDAAQEKDTEHMCEELGDVLFQVVFHSQVTKEQGLFDIEDVIHGVSEKMIRRHPHVFGNTHVNTSGEVLKRWEEIKATENANKQEKKSAMDKVCKSFESLARAEELQRRAAKVGFDWKKDSDSFEKVEEEFKEFFAEATTKNKEKQEEEFGDILFSLINAARHLNLNVSTALSKANSKFEKRFRKMETLANGETLKTKTDSELLKLWKQAKDI